MNGEMDPVSVIKEESKEYNQEESRENFFVTGVDFI
jgi:hypothetical protein